MAVHRFQHGHEPEDGHIKEATLSLPEVRVNVGISGRGATVVVSKSYQNEIRPLAPPGQFRGRSAAKLLI